MSCLPNSPVFGALRRDRGGACQPLDGQLRPLRRHPDALPGPPGRELDRTRQVGARQVETPALVLQVHRTVHQRLGLIHGEAGDTRSYTRLMAGTRRMERQLPDDIRAELHALADTAEVKYDDLVALQLFGDVVESKTVEVWYSDTLWDEETLTGNNRPTGGLRDVFYLSSN